MLGFGVTVTITGSPNWVVGNKDEQGGLLGRLRTLMALGSRWIRVYRVIKVKVFVVVM
jgi:hypothetical protein